MERYLNPKTYRWDGENADYTPVSDDIPWSLIPEHKVTMEDVKYVLSSHYQGTTYDPYLPYGHIVPSALTGLISCLRSRCDHMEQRTAV